MKVTLFALLTVTMSISSCATYHFTPSIEKMFGEELQQMINECPSGSKISVAKGDYYLKSPLLISKSIDIDFGGSTITTPCVSVIKTAAPIIMSKELTPTQLDSKNHLSHIGIKNITINCESSKAETGRQRCIEIHYVDDVLLEGITINNWTVASTSSEHNIYNQKHYGYAWYNDRGFKSYEMYMIAIRYYVTTNISHCEFNNFETEGILLLPSTNVDNFAKITYNKFISNYHSMVQICDGRCYIAFNDCYGNNGSAFNAFCYDSEICNNKFKNGKRSAAIDLCEDGLYKSYNVYVHDNECIDTYDLAYICGRKIKISNNSLSSDKANCGIHIFNGKLSDWECSNTPLNQNCYGSEEIDISNNHFKNIDGYDIYSESHSISDVSIIGNFFDKKYDSNSDQKSYYHFKCGVHNLNISNNIFSTLQRNNHSSGFLGLGEIYGAKEYPTNGHLIVCNNVIKSLEQLKGKQLKGEQTFLVGGYNCTFDTIIVKNNIVPKIDGVSRPFLSPDGLTNSDKALRGSIPIETDLNFYSGWNIKRDKYNLQNK